MRHDLLTLELMMAIAKERSVTGGAQKVHLAVAAASKRLCDLESRLGVRLFTRKARGVEPTEACKTLLRHVVAMQTALGLMDEELMQFARGVRGHVKVLVAPDALPDGLLRHISFYARQQVGVSVSIDEADNFEVEARVAGGDADIGIFVRPLAESRLQLSPYARCRWVALVPQGHALADRERVTLNDLLNFNILGVKRPSVLGAVLDRELADRGQRFEGKLEAAGAETTAALVEAGAGIALIADAQARRIGGAHRVRSVPLAEDWAEFTTVVGARRGKLAVPVKQLIEALSSDMASTRIFASGLRAA